MAIDNVFFESRVMWSQLDANMHLRHSAYADFAAQARLEILERAGLGAATFREHHIGPILFREELIYFREVHANDTVRITCELTKCRKDGSRWSFRQALYRSDDVKAAEINVDGAWIDTKLRKLAALPDGIMQQFMHVPRSADFSETD